MQGKGFVKIITAILLLIVVYQAALLFPIWDIEKKADATAQEAVSIIKLQKEEEKAKLEKEGAAAELLAAAELDEESAKIEYERAYQQYIDEQSSEPLFFGLANYQTLKRQQLALGLDLKGGMSVVLQVDLRELVAALANNVKDADLSKAIEEAHIMQKTSQKDFITLFGEAFQKVAPNRQLAGIFAPANKLKDITLQSSNADVLRAIRAESKTTVQSTYKLLKERIDRFGVAQPVVSLDESTDRVTVELPGVTNPQRAREYLQTTASLEFWDVYRGTDQIGGKSFGQLFIEADEILAAKNKVEGDTATQAGPLLQRFQPFMQASAMLGQAATKDTAMVMALLKETAHLFPRNARFAWSNKAEKDETTGVRYFFLYAIDTKGKAIAPVQGDYITSARMDAQGSEYGVSISMNSQGAREWKKMTERNSTPTNREIAIVLDNKVYSAPRVNGVIAEGNTQITGNFSVIEATDLANILSIGKLPSRTEIIEEAIVGASLGETTVKAGLISLLVGFIGTLVFMLGYYSFAGFISVIALFFNVLIIISCLSSFGTVLTLSGIAGIVLTIGMAVDANVIIFERIREELRKGLSWREATAKGFENSFSSIFDANLTTILVSFILFYFGLGPIKGFATVLLIGITASMFTAVYFGRLIFEYYSNKKEAEMVANGKTEADYPYGLVTLGNAATFNVLAKPQFDFVGKRKLAYIVSTVVILAGIASIFTRGFDLGVDLQGGRSYVVQFNQDVNTEALKEKLVIAMDGYDKNIVKTFNDAKQVKITTAYLQDQETTDTDALVVARIHKAVTEYAGASMPLADFVAQKPSEAVSLTAVSKVGATVADDIRDSAFKTAIFSVIVIFLYIFIRFRRWQYGVGATLSLIHDTLFTVGMFSLLKGILPFSLEVNQEFIAAILTVIGYSINDTIIVYDRIREELKLEESKGKTLLEVINGAINNTLSRTVVTSMSTVAIVLLLFIFGGDAIRGFSFAVAIGIAVGTYSSVFIAAPVVGDLGKDVENMTESDEEYIPEYEREVKRSIESEIPYTEITDENEPKA